MMTPLMKNLVIPMSVTVIAITAFVVTFTLLFKNAGERQKLLPIRVIFFLMITFEVLKIFWLVGKDGYYYTNRFPIVFCSMSMFAYPVFCFKRNRFSDAAKGFSIIPGIAAFILFASIQKNYDMSIMQVHSYFYHGSMLAVAVYLITSKLYVFEFRKFYSQFLLVGGYIAAACVLSMVIGGPISVFAPGDPYLGFVYNMGGYMVGVCVLLIVLFLAYFAVYGIAGLVERHRKPANAQAVKGVRAK